VDAGIDMSEIRKLIRLTKSSYCVSIPRAYRESLELNSNDYVTVALYDPKTIMIRKQGKADKL